MRVDHRRLQPLRLARVDALHSSPAYWTNPESSRSSPRREEGTGTPPTNPIPPELLKTQTRPVKLSQQQSRIAARTADCARDPEMEGGMQSQSESLCSTLQSQAAKETR